MLPHPKRLTQLENFAPTTSQDSAVDAPPVRAAQSDHPITFPRLHIPHKRKVEDKSHSQTSKAIRLSREQSHTRGIEIQETQRDDKLSIRRSYHAFMTIEQAGNAVIAHEQASPARLVAIKRVRPEKETSSCLLPLCKSDRVVNMVDTYVDGPEIVFVYEAMDISLRQLISVCPLHTSKLAAIFKEVVYGLEYLHQELSLVHGSLSYNNILLNQDGAAKIANVGEALVKKIPYTRENVRMDVRSLGNALIEIIELETYSLDPNTLVLRNSGNLDVQAFLTATDNESLEDLKEVKFTKLAWEYLLMRNKHRFLCQKGRHRCFASDVYRAIRIAGIGWDGVIDPLMSASEGELF